MPRRLNPRSLALGLLLAACGTAAVASQNSIFNAMRDMPITHFNNADMALMQRTVYRALEESADGDSLTWENASTRSSGKVTPVADANARKGCRVAQVENRFRSMSGSGSYLFCRNTKSKSPPWQLVSPWPQ